MIRFETTIAALAIGTTISITGPAVAENVLRLVSFSGGALTLDPHSYYDTPNRAATAQVYEALLDVDSYVKIVPQLAVSWRPLGRNHLGIRVASGRKIS
jgi:ABC-type transport system substrate-binding protein